MKIHKKDISRSVPFHKLECGDTFQICFNGYKLGPSYNGEIFMKVLWCYGYAVSLKDGRLASFRGGLQVIPVYRKEM